jgi:hypothetical protein
MYWKMTRRVFGRLELKHIDSNTDTLVHVTTISEYTLISKELICKKKCFKKSKEVT